MNQANCQKIRIKIQEAARSLEGQLPPSPQHPKGRNAYAHIPAVIKSVFGKSYRLLPDEMLVEILEVVKYCEKNPF